MRSLSPPARPARGAVSLGQARAGALLLCLLALFTASAHGAPPAVEAAREEAVAAARAGRHEEALGRLAELHRLHPADDAVRRDLGIVQAWAQRCGEALSTLEPLLASPQPAWVVAPAAECLLREGRPAEARELAERHLALDAGSEPELVVLRARVLAAEGRAESAIEVLDALLAERPESLVGRRERARLREEAGLPFAAFLDRREVLRQLPDDEIAARLAAYNLMAAGAPSAAAELVERHPVAVAGEAGAALRRQLDGDLAARRIRWGWAEPVFDPADRRHEADAAIAELERLHVADPQDQRTTGDLALAYRLADRLEEVVALWEGPIDRERAPYWVRNAAADSYLGTFRPAEAERLYREIAAERPGAPEPWVGLYWALVEQRRYDEARDALARLGELPGHQLAARVQEGWLLLFSDRTAAGEEHFERLFAEHPGDPGIREGLATAQLWQGYPRRGLASTEELLARTTSEVPRVDRAATRISRAGALVALGDLGRARREAEELATLYPENPHAQRLRRDVDTALSPEVRLEGRYDTSDRGLGEYWTQLEVSAPIGTRLRASAGGHLSRSDDRAQSRGDVEEAYLGAAWRVARPLLLSAEAAWDVSGGDLDRDPALRARAAIMPDDRWRVDVGYAADGWRELPLRGRAAGIVADTVDAGLSYHGGTRWNGRLGGGRSELSDDNERTWGLAAAQFLARPGPRYRAYFGGELYGSESTRNDVPYFSPLRDRSASLTHRSEWVTTNRPGRRHTFSLLLHGGVYDQEGFDAGPVGGAWLQSDLDLAGRLVLVLGAGARSQLYDGNRELDPRVFVTLRKRF